MAKKKAELIFFERVHYEDGAILEALVIVSDFAHSRSSIK